MLPRWYKPPPFTLGVTRLETVAKVARIYGMTAGDLVGPSRKRPVVIARWHAMRVLRDQKYSLASIGRVFNRHHTAVLHGLENQGLYRLSDG